jgi:hypothetical protein
VQVSPKQYIGNGIIFYSGPESLGLLPEDLLFIEACENAGAPIKELIADSPDICIILRREMLFMIMQFWIISY